MLCYDKFVIYDLNSEGKYRSEKTRLWTGNARNEAHAMRLYFATMAMPHDTALHTRHHDDADFAVIHQMTGYDGPLSKYTHTYWILNTGCIAFTVTYPGRFSGNSKPEFFRCNAHSELEAIRKCVREQMSWRIKPDEVDIKAYADCKKSSELGEFDFEVKRNLPNAQWRFYTGSRK